MTITSLNFNDAIYGEIKVDHPLAIQILNSAPMQRLKDIDMAGYSTGFYPGCRHTRFEHSVGVYHLLSIHKASLAECIHGLLHDVSHTAFSHAVDYALSDTSGKTQDFQDRIFKTFIAETEIPHILRSFDLDPEYVFNDENFPLQEAPIPNLCADRLDYSFRGFYHYKTLSLSVVRKLLASLRTNGREWFFDSRESALFYASAFSKLDDAIFDSLRGAAMFRSVGDCIKYALHTKILSMNDLFATDDETIAKIKANVEDDSHLSKLWARMNGLVQFKNDAEDYEAVVHCKSRIVDPKFYTEDGLLKKLSETSLDWGAIVEEGLKPKTYHLKFLD